MHVTTLSRISTRNQYHRIGIASDLSRSDLHCRYHNIILVVSASTINVVYQCKFSPRSRWTKRSNTYIKWQNKWSIVTCIIIYLRIRTFLLSPRTSTIVTLIKCSLQIHHDHLIVYIQITPWFIVREESLSIVTCIEGCDVLLTWCG